MVGSSHGVELLVAVLQLRYEELELSALLQDGGALHLAQGLKTENTY